MTSLDDMQSKTDEGRCTKPQTRAVSNWRADLARRSEHLAWPAEALLRLSVLVRQAVPIGLLRSHEIEHMVRAAYSEYPDFYDPDQYHLRYESELLPLLARHTKGKRLLDLYCGHGREAGIFAEAGFQVLGIDADAGSVERARVYLERSRLDAEFDAADINNWHPARFDWNVIYSSLWMYTCIPDRTARTAWLKRVSQWLDRDGLLIISVMPRPSQRAAKFRHLVARSIALLSLNERRPELGDRFHTRLFWHDFSSDEVVDELAEGGLKVLETLEIGGSTPCNFFVAAKDADGGRAHRPEDAERLRDA